MALNYARLDRAELERHVRSYEAAPFPEDARTVAVRATADFNDLQDTALTEAQFQSAVLSIAAKLNVSKPAVPADLAGLSVSALAELAASLDLAYWDWYRRVDALEFTQRFFAKRGTPPSGTDYVAMFTTLANYMRGGRGLTAIA